MRLRRVRLWKLIWVVRLMVDFVLLDFLPGIKGAVPPFFDSILIPAIVLAVVLLWIGNTILHKLGFALW